MMSLAILAASLTGPLVEVPSGWIHLVHRTHHDHMAGKYYDMQSGSSIGYLIGTGARFPAQAGSDWASVGTLSDGTPVVSRAREDAAGAARQELAKAMEVSLDDLDDFDVSHSIPPAGSSSLELQFQRDGYTWLFTIIHCSPEQATRAKGLLLDPKARFRLPRGAARGRPYAITLSAFESNVGKPIEQVLSSLGQPQSAWPHRCGGIALDYSLELKGSSRGYQATFAREAGGRLTHWIEGPFGQFARD